MMWIKSVDGYLVNMPSISSIEIRRISPDSWECVSWEADCATTLARGTETEMSRCLDSITSEMEKRHMIFFSFRDKGEE